MHIQAGIKIRPIVLFQLSDREFLVKFDIKAFIYFQYMPISVAYVQNEKKKKKDSFFKGVCISLSAQYPHKCSASNWDQMWVSETRRYLIETRDVQKVRMRKFAAIL